MLVFSILVFLRCWEVLEDLERSGRLVGRISCTFLRTLIRLCRVMTKESRTVKGWNKHNNYFNVTVHHQFSEDAPRTPKSWFFFDLFFYVFFCIFSGFVDLFFCVCFLPAPRMPKSWFLLTLHQILCITSDPETDSWVWIRESTSNNCEIEFKPDFLKPGSVGY